MTATGSPARTERPTRLRWWPRLLAILALTVVVGVAALATGFPSVAAVGCPGCYGLRSAGEGVYVATSLDADERRAVRAVVADAGRRVTEFYDGRRTRPRVLVCGDQACYDRVGGGGSRGVAVLNLAVLLSPRGANVAIAAHEMSHVELNARLAGATVPQWFDEGLAITVADDRRWLKPATAADRCVARPEGPLPVTLDAWLRAATADVRVSAQAACRVATWMDAHGGHRGVLELVRRLADGAQFDEVFTAAD